MSDVAINLNGQEILASRVGTDIWTEWKSNSALGTFKMACCHTPAILKNSINGLQFFAHYNDECASAPETRWHLEAKALIVATMRSLGIDCDEEIFEGGAQPWRADVLVKFGDRRIAIEIQRSPQHLKDYLRRQERYSMAGVECVWVLNEKNYHTLVKATGRKRLKEEFGGKFPACGSIGPCLCELPVAFLEISDLPAIRGAGMFNVTPETWCRALLDQRFLWSDGIWMIGTDLNAPDSGICLPSNAPGRRR